MADRPACLTSKTSLSLLRLQRHNQRKALKNRKTADQFAVANCTDTAMYHSTHKGYYIKVLSLMPDFPDIQKAHMIIEGLGLGPTPLTIST